MGVLTQPVTLDQKGTFSMPSSRSASRLSVTFDDDHAVADAGLALVAVLSEKLGLEAFADELVDIAPFPGRRVATLVHAMVAGANFIDDADVLRSGATSAVLGHRVMAPSTLGTFLRRFSFGHVRQLDKLAEILLARAWSAGAGPGDEPMTIDMDSTVCPVHGACKEGAGFGYTRVLGYHPLLATRSDTGEVLHVRFRKARPTLVAAPSGSSESSSDDPVAPGRPVHSRCVRTRASSPASSSRRAGTTRFATRSRFARTLR
jgi:hypothetical protein